MLADGFFTFHYVSILTLIFLGSRAKILSIFTFHYVSILTASGGLLMPLAIFFTFHYVSILTPINAAGLYYNTYLYIPLCFYSYLKGGTLTMGGLNNFTFHYVSILTVNLVVLGICLCVFTFHYVSILTISLAPSSSIAHALYIPLCFYSYFRIHETNFNYNCLYIPLCFYSYPG